MLDYKLIEALAVVVQEGGFDKAARRLYLTQSAVSQRVKLLEEQTGQVLLIRTTPPKATKAGQKILKHYLRVKRLEGDLLGEMDESSEDGFTSLAVGINADSLATWFLDAIRPFLLERRVLLDIRVEDQEQTHRLLKDGEVVGCISTMEQPIQGCRSTYIGCMNYRMLATPEFARTWFPKGLTIDAAGRAPIFIFNRKDELQDKLLRLVLDDVSVPIPAHYLPSSEKFVDFIASGLGYGVLPDQQSRHLLKAGRLVDLAPYHCIQVNLFWHCWNIESKLLADLTRNLIEGAKALLEE